MNLLEIEKIAIVVVALFMAYAELAQALKYRKRWIKYGLAIMGLYWAGYYSYSLLRTRFDLTFPEHQIFVRSGILLTLSLVASGAWITLQELRRFDK
jgi:hypothetical protein